VRKLNARSNAWTKAPESRARGGSTSRAGGEGGNRQYKTVLVANEIMLMRSPSDTSDAGEAPAQAADGTVKPAADAEPASMPKRRRAKRAA
jgi:hypothetical protein